MKFSQLSFQVAEMIMLSFIDGLHDIVVVIIQYQCVVNHIRNCVRIIFNLRQVLKKAVY